MIYLHGGGWAEDESTWTGLFVDEAARLAGRPPTIAVVLHATTHAEGAEFHDDYTEDLVKLGAGDVRIVQLTDDPPRSLAGADLDGCHGIFVGGGHTPSYHRTVLPAAESIRGAVARGVPYLGMSAGAMIAGDVALLGGWQLHGTPVAPESWGEGLAEITLAPGLGLVRPLIDVHTGRGLLARAASLVAAGQKAEALAIDEDTIAIVDAAGAVSVAGLGAVWTLRADGDGVHLTRTTA